MNHQALYDTIKYYKQQCDDVIKRKNEELEKAIEHKKTLGWFRSEFAEPTASAAPIINAKLHIELATETIRFCDDLEKQIRQNNVDDNIYELLQNKLSELESDRSTTPPTSDVNKTRISWIGSKQNVVSALLKIIPRDVKNRGQDKAKSKIEKMSEMQKTLIKACDSYVAHYQKEIVGIGPKLTWDEQWKVGSMHECIQLVNDLKKSLSKMKDDDDAPVILEHYKEKVKQEESSYAKPLFASFRENEDELSKRKVTKYSFACKRLIMDSIYDVFHTQEAAEAKKIRDYLGEYAVNPPVYPVNPVNTVNTVITKTLLRFRDMHEKLIRERKAQYGNEPALAAVNMKLTGINEILDFIESFRKLNKKNTVNALLEQMSTLLSQSSEETEDAKLNPLKNIVVFLNEVKKIMVEPEEVIAAAHANEAAEANAPERNPTPPDPNAFELKDIVTGGRRCKRTGRKRSGKKRTSKKRKRTRRRH
jgi:hypothetical protein